MTIYALAEKCSDSGVQNWPQAVSVVAACLMFVSFIVVIGWIGAKVL